MTDLNFNLRRFKSIFSELVTAEPRAEVELDAIYGLNTVTKTETFTADGGSVDTYTNGTDGRLFRCQTGTTSGGYGLVRSQRSVRYKPGQEIRLGITAAFSSPAANSTQRAGGVTSGAELSFGYNGTRFGLLRRRGGKLEHYRFDITAAATGNETVTVTLDGTEFEVAVTSGTAKHNAFELASATYTGWTVWHNDDSVYFLAQALGDKTGTFSMASTGTLAATAVKVADGADATDDWVYQDEWNIDPMDGTGPSTMTLNPQVLNLYRIRFGYLGAANLIYEIYHPGREDFYPVHEIKHWDETGVSTNTSNPYFKMGWFAASLGSTTNLVTYGGSAYGHSIGKDLPTRNPFGATNTNTNVTTTYKSILTVRIRRVYQNRVNLLETLLKSVSVGNEGNKPIEVILVVNAELSGEPDWQYSNEDVCICENEKSDLTVTVGNESSIVWGNSLAKSDADAKDVSHLKIKLSPLDTITLAAKTSSGTNEVNGSMVWEVA